MYIYVYLSPSVEEAIISHTVVQNCYIEYWTIVQYTNRVLPLPAGPKVGDKWLICPTVQLGFSSLTPD